jgi:ABC-type Na+ efflux pump permease subunit
LQSSELVSLQTRLKDANLLITDMQSKQLPVEFQLTKALHEKDLLENKVKYLEEELQKKVNDEKSTRNDLNNKISELEGSLHTQTNENADGKVQISSLKVLFLLFFVFIFLFLFFIFFLFP